MRQLSDWSGAFYYRDAVFYQLGPSHVFGPSAENILVLYKQGAQLPLLQLVVTIFFRLCVQVHQIVWETGALPGETFLMQLAWLMSPSSTEVYNPMVVPAFIWRHRTITLSW